MKQTVSTLAAEVKAVELGHRATLRQDGTFRVVSASRPGKSWTVTVGLVSTPEGWAVKCSCECESGAARPAQAVSCWHSATVCRSLERRGWAKWRGGLWYATQRTLRMAVAS